MILHDLRRRPLQIPIAAHTREVLVACLTETHDRLPTRERFNGHRSGDHRASNPDS